ncbi:MAG: sigma-70 family RNA polymerase sigma factor [Planctomycetota bacterium]
MHDELLRHASWIRNLAKDLTRHHEDAEDVAQEVFLRAVQHPPPEGLDERRLRAWLRVVVRNLAVRRFHSDSGRRSREAAAARPEEAEAFRAVGSGDELVERLNAALGRLDEDSRRILLLRYEEDLPPREIARRLGLTGLVARKRLSRALARLRRELQTPDERPARGRVRGLFALPALWRRERGGSGSSWFSARAALALASAVLLGSVAVWTLRPERARVERLGQVDSRARDSVELPRLVEPSELDAGSARKAPPAPPAASEVKVDAARVDGTVVDLWGTPVGGIEIVFEPGDPRSSIGRPWGFLRAPIPAGQAGGWTARSDGAGAFQLPVPTGTAGRVAVRSERYSLVVAELVSGAHAELLGSRVVVAERQPIDGYVVDGGGRPVRFAQVAFESADVSLAGCRNPQIVHPNAVTDEDGAFVIENSYAADNAILVASDAKLGSTRVPLGGNRRGLRIELRREESDGLPSGYVIDPSGAPVPLALVSVHGRLLRANDRGRFPLRPVPEGRRPSIRAISPGYLPAVWEPEDGDDLAAIPDPIVMRLEDRPVTLRARVVDWSGAPAADCEVWISDPTPFGFLDQPHFVETLSSVGPAFAVRGKTDADGNVAIEGLMDRTYRLRIVRRKTSTLDEIFAAPRPDPIVLRLGRPADLSPRRGRVLTRAGQPVSHARVTAGVNVVDAPFPSLGGPVKIGMNLATATTDEMGEFDLPPLPADNCILHVTGTHVIPGEYAVSELPLGALELHVSQPARLRFDVAGRDPAELIYAYDDAGRHLSFYETHGDLVHQKTIPYERISVAMAAESEWLLPSEAAELVLHHAGEERGRVRILAAVDGLNHVLLPAE